MPLNFGWVVFFLSTRDAESYIASVIRKCLYVYQPNNLRTRKVVSYLITFFNATIWINSLNVRDVINGSFFTPTVILCRLDIPCIPSLLLFSPLHIDNLHLIMPEVPSNLMNKFWPSKFNLMSQLGSEADCTPFPSPCSTDRCRRIYSRLRV